MLDTPVPSKPKRRVRRKRQHGTGGIYKRGSSYLIKWREKGRQRYKTFTDEELARRALARITGDVQAEGVGLSVPKPPSPFFRVLAVEWLERRALTHRAIKQDRSRWKKHLEPFFGRFRPDEVDAARIREFVESKRAKLNAATVGHCLRLLSSFYADLVERELAESNPVRTLPRSTRRLVRPTTDPKDTPFIESLATVRAVFQSLPEPVSVGFAIGALAGLRTGEVLGLSWRDVDLDGRRIYVRQQVADGKLGPLKDDEARVVPIQNALRPILTRWKVRSGGEGFLFAPTYAKRGGRPGRPPKFMRARTFHRYLAEALDECELPDLTWYQSTRHTFASLWVLGGGSIEKLATIMGHSSIVVTERYAHLRPDLFADTDYSTLGVDLMAQTKVLQFVPETAAGGCTVVTDAIDDREKLNKRA